jgi:hypothetical protein
VEDLAAAPHFAEISGTGRIENESVHRRRKTHTDRKSAGNLLYAKTIRQTSYMGNRIAEKATLKRTLSSLFSIRYYKRKRWCYIPWKKDSWAVPLLWSAN